MKRYKGYSLIELSITLVVIGLIASIAIQYFKIQKQMVTEDYDQTLLRPIHQAIDGYVYANHHLPCPAANGNGVADCGLTKGFLPYQDLGLSQNNRNTSGLVLRYAVYGRLSADTGGALPDINQPYIAQGTPPYGLPRTLGNRNGLDMCQAIINARDSTFDNTLLHVSDGISDQAVAYVIVDPGHEDSNNDGDVLDGVNAQNNMQYQKASTIANIDYDDYVSPMYFDAFWEQLGCVHAESPAGHAHPNVASAASIMVSSITDYKVLLDFAVDIADANIASATANVLMSAAAIATAVGPALTGTALAITTFGAMAPSIALAAVATAAAAATTVVAANAAVKADANLDVAEAHVIEAAGYIVDATAINATIYQHVLDADAAGI